MSQTLTDRLDRIERDLLRQRRLTRGFATAFFGLAGLAVAAGAAAVSQDFDTVTAKKIIIKDADGKGRITLEAPKAGASGDAKIAILAADGQEICVMGQYSDSIALFYTQRVGGDAPRASLYSMTDFAGTDASGGGGNTPLSMTASKDWQKITVADRNDRKPSIDLTVQNETATISIVDASGATKYLVEQGSPKAVTTSSVPTRIEATSASGVLQFTPK